MKIDSMITGGISERDEDDEPLVKDSLCLNYAPIVSFDVERSFSKHKTILRDNPETRN